MAGGVGWGLTWGNGRACSNWWGGRVAACATCGRIRGTLRDEMVNRSSCGQCSRFAINALSGPGPVPQPPSFGDHTEDPLAHKRSERQG